MKRGDSQILEIPTFQKNYDILPTYQNIPPLYYQVPLRSLNKSNNVKNTSEKRPFPSEGAPFHAVHHVFTFSIKHVGSLFPILQVTLYPELLPDVTSTDVLVLLVIPTFTPVDEHSCPGDSMFLIHQVKNMQQTISKMLSIQVSKNFKKCMENRIKSLLSCNYFLKFIVFFF